MPLSLNMYIYVVKTFRCMCLFSGVLESDWILD